MSDSDTTLTPTPVPVEALIPRQYQWEIFHRAIEENVVCRRPFLGRVALASKQYLSQDMRNGHRKRQDSNSSHVTQGNHGTAAG